MAGKVVGGEQMTTTTLPCLTQWGEGCSLTFARGVFLSHSGCEAPSPQSPMCRLRCFSQRTSDDISCVCAAQTKTLLGKAVSLGLDQCLQSSGQLFAEAFDIMVVMDVLYDATKTCAKLLHCLVPRTTLLGDLLTVPDPARQRLWIVFDCVVRWRFWCSDGRSLLDICGGVFMWGGVFIRIVFYCGVFNILF